MVSSAEEILEYVKENDVKFIRLAFCDIFGVQKNIAIQPSELPRAFECGISFDASAISGFMPDIIITRCDEPLEETILQKIALFCNVEEDCVIENLTLPVLYEAPLMLEKNGLARVVCRKLGLQCGAPDLSDWNAMLDRVRSATKPVKIALVGKYTKLHDAYLSVNEALSHEDVSQNR